jgi:hypothetical protein
MVLEQDWVGGVSTDKQARCNLYHARYVIKGKCPYDVVGSRSEAGRTTTAKTDTYAAKQILIPT